MNMKVVLLTTVLFGLGSHVASLKVAIKAHNEDLCIRVKDTETIVLDQCYWKLKTSTKTQEVEQTFDIHPRDVHERGGESEINGNSSSSFLIRLSRRNRMPSSFKGKTCLSSITSTLSVEKCDLRKSRFRISGIFLDPKSNHSCPSISYPSQYFRYKFHSFDKSCLKLNRSSSNKTLVFSKCASNKEEKDMKSQMWQLCMENGNCALSPDELKWSSHISTEFQSNKANETTCPKVEQSTHVPIIEGDIIAQIQNISSNYTLENMETLPNGTISGADKLLPFWQIEILYIKSTICVMLALQFFIFSV